MTHVDIQRWLASDNSRQTKLVSKNSSDGSSSITLPKIRTSRQDDWDQVDNRKQAARSRQPHGWGEVDWGTLPTISSKNSQLVTTTYRSDRPNYVYVNTPRTSRRSPEQKAVYNTQSRDIWLTGDEQVIDGKLYKTSVGSVTRSSSANLAQSPASVMTNTLSKGYVSVDNVVAKPIEDLMFNVNVNGFTGIKNLGNTCFMNSVFQCLSNTRPLLEFCIDSKQCNFELRQSAGNTDGRLVHAFIRVVCSLWSGKEYIAPTELHEEITRIAEKFGDYRQHDAQEFLIYLLEGLQKDMNRIPESRRKTQWEVDDATYIELSDREKARLAWSTFVKYEYSKIVDIFVGQMKSTLTCTQCGHSSVTFDPFIDLSLPIRKKNGLNTGVPLMDCFHLFTQQELLTGDNKALCEQCGVPRTSTKEIHIQKFPKVLVLQLKRFNVNSYNPKLSTEVRCPVVGLDLERFAAEQSPSGSTVYNLFAVVNHSGSPSSGHYTAVARHPYTGQWRMFNDHRVTTIPESRVISSDAYILFYEYSSR